VSGEWLAACIQSGDCNEPGVTELAERAPAALGTVSHPTPETRDLLVRIQGEYREMPGLCLTASQAQRLWSIDPATCDTALATLTARRILRRTAIGTYVRGPSC